jgi:hypothetical protein
MRFGPGADVPAPPAGITNVKDLPAPQLVAFDRHHEPTPGPRCAPLAPRHPWGHRTWHALGDGSTGHPVDLLVAYASPSGSTCRKPCNIALTESAAPGSHDPHRGVQRAVRLVVEDGVPYRPASGHLWRAHRVFVPCATIQPWGEAGGKKGAGAQGQRLAGLGA